MKTSATKGNTITEYGIVLALLVIMSIAALTTLGGSISTLFSGQSNELASKKVDAFTSLNFSDTGSQGGKASGTTAKGGGLLSGLMATGGGWFSTNATSTEGGKLLTLNEKSTKLLTDTESIFEQITDGPTKEWAAKMAELMYYIGGAEGHLAGVDALTVDEQRYNKANALADIYTYYTELQKLIANPPFTASQQEREQLLALVNQSLASAKPYIDQVKPFVARGEVDMKDLAKETTGDDKVSKSSYDELVNYSEMKDNAEEALADRTTTSEPELQATLQNAATVDQAAAPTPAKR